MMNRRGQSGFQTCIQAFVGLVFCLVFTSAVAHAAQLTPRSPSLKPIKTIVQRSEHHDRVTIKFKDDLPIRLLNGQLTDDGLGTLAPAANLLQDIVGGGGDWRSTYTLADDKLQQLRINAQNNSGKAVADLRLQFDLILPAGADAAAIIDRFNALDIVEIAQPIPLPVPPPLPPNFQSGQGYLSPAPEGIGASGAWTGFFDTGAGIKIADIEYSWNRTHQDLPPTTLLGAAPVDPFNDLNHGTAVLGEMVSLSNGWGTTGIAYDASIYLVAANTSAGYNVGGAISTALGTLGPGDIILIEQQIGGPNGGTNYVPVEWFRPTYNIIVTAVANGVAVIEAAANGSQNLDAAIYSTGNGGHWPFLLQNDSGAILVGAGAAPAPSGSDVDRSRLSFSNYGATVDVQGWGQAVYSTGYGNVYNSEGANLYYTSSFSGTSSASPIVAASCALLQSKYKSTFGVPMSPGQMRTLLRSTGSPQQAGSFPVSQNIGPRPDVISAVHSFASPAPDNNDCANAVITPAGASYPFTTLGATTDGPDEPGACNFNGFTNIANDVWFRLPAECTGTATISLCGSNFNAKLAVYSNPCPGAPGQAIACNDNFCGNSPQVTFPVVFGAVYRIRIGGGVSGVSGSGTMVITCTPAVPPCPADITHNNAVDVDDLLAVINAWGPCAGCPADIAPLGGGNGFVDVDDLLAVINAWGPCP